MEQHQYLDNPHSWVMQTLFQRPNLRSLDDGEYVYNSPIINGAACHTMHHLYFNYNYGQFTTLWDRMGGSYRPPNQELFSKEAKMSSKEWQRQAKEMETLQKDVEGEDDRHYGVEAARVQKKTL